MPRKSNKRRTNRRGRGKGKGTRKQKPIVMIGCSKKNKRSCKNSQISSLSDKGCPNCGPNCHCGPNCKCPHPCPGNCYLNRRMKKQKGGSGCGSCGCPLSPLSWNKMNQFGGNSASYPNVISQPVMLDTSTGVGRIPPILGTNQNGGTCGACGQMPLQAGGSFYKPAAPMPGPFTGSAWQPNMKWPGMDGISSNRNYLASYADTITNDPQQQMTMNNAGYKTMNSMVGGYRYDKKSSPKSSSSVKSGGGLIPQDLVNLGRDFTHNFSSAYNALNGYKAPVDPAPYKGQLTGALNNNRFML